MIMYFKIATQYTFRPSGACLIMELLVLVTYYSLWNQLLGTKCTRYTSLVVSLLNEPKAITI